MRIETGWYSEYEYYVVKPLHNKQRQVLIMFAQSLGGGRWNVGAGVFSCNVTYRSLALSDVWETPTSTNKNPSITTVRVALEALQEIEQVITQYSQGKRRYIYVDGLDERRQRVYTKLLTKEKYNYKKSTVKCASCDLPMLYKRLG